MWCLKCNETLLLSTPGRPNTHQPGILGLAGIEQPASGCGGAWRGIRRSTSMMGVITSSDISTMTTTPSTNTCIVAGGGVSLSGRIVTYRPGMRGCLKMRRHCVALRSALRGIRCLSSGIFTPSPP